MRFDTHQTPPAATGVNAAAKAGFSWPTVIAVSAATAPAGISHGRAARPYMRRASCSIRLPCFGGVSSTAVSLSPWCGQNRVDASGIAQSPTRQRSLPPPLTTDMCPHWIHTCGVRRSSASTGTGLLLVCGMLLWSSQIFDSLVAPSGTATFGWAGSAAGRCVVDAAIVISFSVLVAV